MLLAASLAGHACDSSPAAPAFTPAPAGGSWRGVVEITSCSASSGTCGRTPPHRFSLHTEGFQGVLLIDVSEFGDQPPLTVDLTLTASGAGYVASGSAELPRLMSSPQRIEVRLDIPSTEPALAGSLRYTLSSAASTVTREGRILSAARENPYRAGALDGRWAGTVVRMQCSGGCEHPDPILWSGSLVLDIAQSGGSVTARFNAYQLGGAASGTSLTLEAFRQLPESQCRWFFDDGPVCMYDIRMTATVDRLQRLRGTLTYKAEAFDSRRQRFQMEAVADLAHVARWQ